MKRATWISGCVLTVLVLGVPATRAQDPDPVTRAIDRGAAYLKSQQKGDGTWDYPQIGATALAALTLLECEVPADDPSIQKAAQAVREASVSLTHTYSLALSILFLDRLGAPGDEALIESMAVRLLAGQNDAGGWSYDCPLIGDQQEIRRLTTHLKQRNELVTKPAAARQVRKNGKPDPTTLPRDVQGLLKNLQAMKPQNGIGDNSNTQFATLALWVARRYDMPVDRALAALDVRFRKTQNADGGWGYVPATLIGSSSASMTCAGLLGLGVAHGAATMRTTLPAGDKSKVRADPAKGDPAVRAGLLALGSTIGQPVGKNKRAGVQVQMLGRGAWEFYYLWSLERVAVAYGLKTIGNKDWYAWGSELLVASQNANGSWQTPGMENGFSYDTCFALLFLRRANLAQDLSATLKGQVQDPGEVNLKSGGVGGDALIAKGLAPAIGPGSKVGAPPPSDPRMISKRNDTTPSSDATATGDPDAQAAQLTANLVKAPPARQVELIDKLKASKGVQYTQALADAIHKLDGPAKNKARDALAERLASMTPATLRTRLQDEDAELRSAAALACAMRDDKQFVPDLVPLLQDTDPRVGRAAHLALTSLSGKDFGPTAGASQAERETAIAAWKAWWAQQNK